MRYINKIKEKIKYVEKVNVLNEDMMWQHHGPLVWEANDFDGIPSFYNVYKYKNYYSYSILALVLLKNNIKINSKVFDTVEEANFVHHFNNETIDLEISKINALHDYNYSITDVDEYCCHIATALKEDIKLIEEKNEDYINIVMCGGKDSMNLLLLPWKNPVVAISAEPNYNLVCEFVRNNNLNIDVRKLEDTFIENALDTEILESFCRADLTHWRWGVDLQKIVSEYSNKSIIWKGQMGDLYLTDNWKHYITPYVEPIRTIRRIYKKFSYLLPYWIHRRVGHKFQPVVLDRIWGICNNLQGAHMSFLRALTDSLVLSAYHGRNVRAVIAKADFGAVLQKDVRPKIGKILLGRDVIYPKSNPSPKVSSFREGLHKPDRLIELLQNIDVEIIHPNDLNNLDKG